MDSCLIFCKGERLTGLLVVLLAGLPEPADSIGNVLFIGVVQVAPQYQLIWDKEVCNLTVQCIGKSVKGAAGVPFVVFNSAYGGEVHGWIAFFCQGSLAQFGRLSIGQYPVTG